MTLDKRIEICYAVFVSMKEASGRECPAFFMVFFFLEVFSHGNEPKERFVLSAGNSDSAGCWHCIALLDGQCAGAGQAISPLHIPVLICGLTCGWCWGMGLGIVLPLLRSVLFGMPPLVPVAIPMAFEMAAYGALCGLLYPMLSKKMSKAYWAMLIAMVIAMLAGRLVGGAAKAVVMGIQGNAYTFPAFVTAYFVNTAVRRGDSPDCCAAGGDGAGESAAIAVGLEMAKAAV